MDKRYLWALEIFRNGRWEPSDCALSRAEIRKLARVEKSWGEFAGKVRIRKYIPEEK